MSRRDVRARVLCRVLTGAMHNRPLSVALSRVGEASAYWIGRDLPVGIVVDKVQRETTKSFSTLQRQFRLLHCGFVLGALLRAIAAARYRDAYP